MLDSTQKLHEICRCLILPQIHFQNFDDAVFMKLLFRLLSPQRLLCLVLYTDPLLVLYTDPLLVLYTDPFLVSQYERWSSITIVTIPLFAAFPKVPIVMSLLAFLKLATCPMNKLEVIISLRAL